MYILTSTKNELQSFKRVFVWIKNNSVEYKKKVSMLIINLCIAHPHSWVKSVHRTIILQEQLSSFHRLGTYLPFKARGSRIVNQQKGGNICWLHWPALTVVNFHVWLALTCRPEFSMTGCLPNSANPPFGLRISWFAAHRLFAPQPHNVVPNGEEFLDPTHPLPRWYKGTRNKEQNEWCKYVARLSENYGLY